MSPYAWSLLAWIGGWMVLFAVLETLAVLDVVPWNTFSWTFAQLAARNRLAAILLLGITGALFFHLNFGWPSRKGTRVDVQETEGDR